MAYLKRSFGTITERISTGEIRDDAVTLAKMVAGTDGNIISYDASGNPVAIATGSDGQALTSAGAGAPPAFEAVAGLGALTGSDTWRIYTPLTAATGNSNIVTANWERDDTAMGESTLGGMSQASGVFTFPSTGLWWVEAFGYYGSGVTGDFTGFLVQVTTNNSSYSHRAEAYCYIGSSGRHQNTTCSCIVDVTDTANVKVRGDFYIPASGASNIILSGHTGSNHSGLTFIRLGGT
jgi:hypothetical protein